MTEIERMEAMGFHHYYDNKLWAKVIRLKTPKVDRNISNLKIIIAIKFSIDPCFAFYEGDQKGHYKVGQPLYANLDALEAGEKFTNGIVLPPCEWPLEMTTYWAGMGIKSA